MSVGGCRRRSYAAAGQRDQRNQIGRGADAETKDDAQILIRPGDDRAVVVVARNDFFARIAVVPWPTNPSVGDPVAFHDGRRAAIDADTLEGDSAACVPKLIARIRRSRTCVPGVKIAPQAKGAKS